MINIASITGMPKRLFTWHWGQLSRWSEFTPVPPDGSTFVYMIPPQSVMPVRVTPAQVHPGCCTGARNLLWHETSQQYHVNAKRPHVSSSNRSAGRLEQVAHALCLRFWITCILSTLIYVQIARCEMSQSSCKPETKSKSHPGMKLAPVRVFSCKHPLRIGVHLQNREVYSWTSPQRPHWRQKKMAVVERFFTNHLKVYISCDFHNVEEEEIHYPSPLDKSNRYVSQWCRYYYIYASVFYCGLSRDYYGSVIG